MEFDSYREPYLSTERLTLEPLTAWHGESLFPFLREPMLYSYIPKEPPVAGGEVVRGFERLETRRSDDGKSLWLNWAVRETAGGYAGLVEATVEQGDLCWIAYWVFLASQGHGIGREAVGAMLAHLNAAGIHAAMASIDTRNRRSIKLVEALGFERVETRVMASKLRGVWVDDHIYRKVL